MTSGILTPRTTHHSALLHYLPRLCRWPALALGVTFAWALTWWPTADITTAVGAVWLIRSAVVVGVIAALFALDDPSRNVTEPAVGARRWLVPVRLVAASFVVALAAAPTVVATGHLVTSAVLWGLALEAAAMLSLLTGVALTLQRRLQVAEPAQYAALGVLLLAVADFITAGRWPLLVWPGPAWASAHGRWALVAAAGVALCAWQLRDPAARPILRSHSR